MDLSQTIAPVTQKERPTASDYNTDLSPIDQKLWRGRTFDFLSVCNYAFRWTKLYVL